MSILAIASVTVGMHIASQHVPEYPHHEQVNPGLYVRMDRMQLGAYRNSYGRATVYAGYAAPLGPVELMVGVASGYTRRCTTQSNTYTTKVKTENGYVAVSDTVVTENCMGFGRGALVPLAALSYVVPVEVGGFKPRMWFLPGVKGHSSVFSLSVEREF